MEIARTLYAVEGRISALPSYCDQNFYLEATRGCPRVLKVSRSWEDREALDLQNRMMEHVTESGFALEVPRVIPTLDGERIATVAGPGGVRHYARLLVYVEGTPCIEKATHPAGCFEQLGRRAGELDQILEGFSHPAMDRTLLWDPVQLPSLRGHLDAIDSRQQRRTVARVFDRFESVVADRVADLRTGVIHNDFSVQNTLMNGAGELTGLIDFCEAVRSATVCEVAVAMAYAMLVSRNPLAVGEHVLRGYHAVYPLGEAELDVVVDLALARLAISVISSAHCRRIDPQNAYVTVCEAPAWRVIGKLIDCEPGWAQAICHGR